MSNSEFEGFAEEPEYEEFPEVDEASDESYEDSPEDVTEYEAEFVDPLTMGIGMAAWKKLKKKRPSVARPVPSKALVPTKPLQGYITDNQGMVRARMQLPEVQKRFNKISADLTRTTKGISQLDERSKNDFARLMALINKTKKADSNTTAFQWSMILTAATPLIVKALEKVGAASQTGLTEFQVDRLGQAISNAIQIDYDPKAAAPALILRQRKAVRAQTDLPAFESDVFKDTLLPTDSKKGSDIVKDSVRGLAENINIIPLLANKNIRTSGLSSAALSLTPAMSAVAHSLDSRQGKKALEWVPLAAVGVLFALAFNWRRILKK